MLHDFPPREPLARDALFLLPRPYASFAAVLQAVSTGTRCDTWRDRFDRIDLVACRVPRDDLNRAVAAGAAWRPPFGLAGRVWADAGGAGTPVAAPMPFAYCAYPLDEPPLGRFGLGEWTGTIEVPRDGEYLFRLHPDSTALDIDGTRVIDDAGERAFGGGHDGRIDADRRTPSDPHHAAARAARTVLPLVLLGAAGRRGRVGARLRAAPAVRG